MKLAHGANRGTMQTNFDLFAEPVSTPAAALSVGSNSAPVVPTAVSARAQTRTGRTLHPTVASAAAHLSGPTRTRGQLREELLSASVATVKFDAEARELVRISQFIPAGNQCIGLYPGLLVAMGQDLLRELQLDTGVIEWTVVSDQLTSTTAPAAEGEQDDEAERPGA